MILYFRLSQILLIVNLADFVVASKQTLKKYEFYVGGFRIC